MEKLSSIEKEWKAVRTQVGFLDLSHQGKILVEGKDRASFLHNMFSNDIKSLTPGIHRYTTLLTPKGKIISDIDVYAFENYFILELYPENVKKVVDRLNSFIITEDVMLKDVSPLFGHLSFQGPLSNEKILSGNFQAFDHERCGEKGYDFIIPMKNLETQKIQSIGLTTYNILRIEAGIPWYGSELDETIIPNEANLENAISWTKGCYPGQEIVARVKYLGGVQKKLTGIVMEGNVIPQKGDRILKDEKEIGIITSAVYSFQLSCPIALAYLKTASATPDEKIQIHHEDKILNGKVQSLPFYKRQETSS
ncbi:MAG: hypothetical protein HYS08_06050 [Chlamydiae bacterium]|nr:hypothetical protein [Chlamydiota bacterium]MBI3266455.1 hypothetical protein [Chlamydiota bacterium]